MVSGSNMSGKSTPAPLGRHQYGFGNGRCTPYAPHALRPQRPLQVGASIRINDSLYEGSFAPSIMAEITRLRQLFEPSALPLLFLLDELLQGNQFKTTGGSAAQGVLRALIERGSIGLVSTHDLALADGAPTCARGALKNVHFPG